MSVTATYSIVGMTCQHCVVAVTKELSALDGVDAVDVDLDSGNATVVSHRPLDLQAVRVAVDEAGYDLKDA